MPQAPATGGGRARALRALAATLLALAVPQVAHAAERPAWHAPKPGPLPLASSTGHVLDSVIDAGERRPAARASATRDLRANASVAVRHTSEGVPVRVEVSGAYASDAASEQTLVDFLGSRLHGPELGDLTTLVATPGEVEEYCGPSSLACYDVAKELMVLPGEDAPGVEVTKEFIATHELGHHIAANRDNSPWPGVDWGPKRWASYERVCQGMRSGSLGRGYDDDPGEGFAQAYALLHYPEADWGRYTTLLQPDLGSLRAIEADVRQPWRLATRRTLTGRLTRSGRARARSFRVAVPLDGLASFALRGPRGTDFDISVTDGRRLVGRNVQRGSGGFLSVPVCGERVVTVTVNAYHGTGRFRLTVRTP
jgi:hypothetical protein